MDTPTKQRLVGAAVLVALAVIFLPMLVKGPAPDSGVSDVPLEMPQAPADGDIETRELPLVAPQGTASGALDAPAAPGERLPTVDTSNPGADGAPMQPAAVAAGDYAVHFGSYATAGDADTIVRQLRQSQLPGFREQTTLNGRTAWRVRIGPYASRAEAEAVRLRAAQVRGDVGARVVVLDAAPPAPTASQPAAAPATAAVRSEPLPPEPARTAAAAPVAGKSAVNAQPAKPAEAAAAAPKPVAPPSAPAPAAPDTGFAVQVGAFGNAAEATRLRDRLRAAGFTAFTESVNSDKGALTRVRVGPVLTRAEADRLRSQVSAKAGVSGMVRPHP